MPEDIEVNVHSVSPNEKTPLGSFNSDGLPPVHSSFNLDPSVTSREAEAALDAPPEVDAKTLAALEAAGYKVEAPAPPPAPEAAAVPGVTQEQLAALEAAGYTVTPPAGAPEPAPAQPAGPIDAADLEAYTREFLQAGKLSDERRAEIRQKYNVTDAVIDGFLNGAQAQNTLTAQAALQQVGATMDDFNTWAKWSTDHEGEDMRRARADQLTSPDPSIRNIALQNLRDTYNKSMGTEPAPVRGGVPAMSHKSFAETLDEAMQDPRYHRKDAIGDAFRERVYKSLERSK